MNASRVSLGLPALDLRVRLEGMESGEIQHHLGFLGPRLSAPAAGDSPHIRIETLETGMRHELSVLEPMDEVRCARGRRRIVCFPDGCHHYRIDTLSAVVRRAGVGYGIALKAALLRAFALQGVIAVHALAFEHAGLGYLVLGDSGSGKSTLAAAVLLGGGRIVSDDLVLFGLGREGRATAMPYRADLVLREPAYRHYRQELADVGVEAMPLRVGEERKWRIARAVHPGYFVEATAIDVVLVLSKPGDCPNSRMRRVSQAAVGTGLMRENYFLSLPHPLEQRAILGCFPRLLAGVSGLRVVLGRDLLKCPRTGFVRIVQAVARACSKAGSSV